MAVFKKWIPEPDDKFAKIVANCFDDPISSVNFFIKNKSKGSICYACTDKNNIISALTSIPYKIKLGENFFDCSYLYAACTAPKYRKQGYMKKLINLYEVQSKVNGFDFSVLVPENKQLENYYRKLGYKNFFKIKEINLNKEQFLDICRRTNIFEKRQIINEKIVNKNFYKNIEKLKFNIYNNISHVLYSSKDIEYAANLYNFFGGKCIGFAHGYGLCLPKNAETLEIKDFTCKKEFVPCLLQKIYVNFPNFEKFKIKTTANDTFFQECFKTYFFGMIKPLSKTGKTALEKFIQNGKSCPYLGIALD